MKKSYFLIGTDEAGYGPFLGPLAVTATLWEVDKNIPPEGIYEALAPVVGVSPKEATVAVTDSKKLYKTSVYRSLAGIAPIEKAVLGMQGEEFSPLRGELPWEEAEQGVPLAHTAEEIRMASEEIRRKMAEAGVFLRGVKSELVFPERFNRETRRCGSKGVLLMEVTLGLAAELYRQASGETVVFCDKLGGRNFYLAPLVEFFPEASFAIRHESRDSSEYAAEGLTVRFQAKGEGNIAVALASLVSKYQRELAMLRFNAWWQAKLPGLRPTEGYPEDARRFLAEISAKAEEMGIPREKFWRER